MKSVVLASGLLSVALFATAVFFLCLAPYTKVEESFNLHAIYDVLTFGIDDLDQYDHKEFPGVVKRTFIGALTLATSVALLPASIIRRFGSLVALIGNEDYAQAYDITRLDSQFTARLLLCLFNCFGLHYLKSQIIASCNKRSRTVGLWFALLQFTQFHIVFYSSRTLPNFIALPLVNIALGSFINGDIPRSLCLLFFVGIIFRLEILLFAGVLSIVTFIRRQIDLRTLLVVGLLGTVGGGITSYEVDSFFWGESTLPELDSFLFNLIHGKSKEWGTEPFYAYFTKYLPRIFLIPLVPLLCAPGFTKDLVNYHVGTMQTISISSIVFVAIMSLQPHKEWRFIIYAVPGITMAASTTIARLTESKYTHMVYKIVLVGACLVNFILSFFSAYVSSFNYPGGEALTRLNLKLYSENNDGMIKPIIVHTSVSTCMEGASLFNSFKDETYQISYDKTEDPETLSSIWDTFDYIITEVDIDSVSSPADMPVEAGCQWLKIDAIDGLKGIDKEVIIRLVKNPQKFLINARSAIEKLNWVFFRDTLNSFIDREPSIFVYEKSCQATAFAKK
ncbi:DEKNAAC104489 [Brettanomyces naardenensis]|uniref:Mannosyltransferase n=1 Tax=Brettanomyces naardenensis TaxID=13370 RepID=A0A448YRJ2_BRENA|nr:DEKNAAC104489 [Brettanomyces naardenensis]